MGRNIIIQDEQGEITGIYNTSNEIDMKIYDTLMNPKLEEVLFPGFGVSKHPQFSEEYLECNGVVILGDRFSGLAHYNSKTEVPEIYLQEMIDKIRKEGELGDLLAIHLEGDKEHGEHIRSFLSKEGVRLITGYSYQGDKNGKFHPIDYKTILVTPSTREVFMIGYAVNSHIQLYPKLSQ